MCVSHAFVTGVYLGDAFEVPQHLLGQTFYAAVVLKVKKTYTVFLCGVCEFLEC